MKYTLLSLILMSQVAFAVSTHVTEDSKVVGKMGLQVTPSLEKGDSVEWAMRRQQGWLQWQASRSQFPRMQNDRIETYLSELATAFNASLLTYPKPRFHFYVVDTLNPSIWPIGGGFFVMHAGLLRHIEDERQFAFLLALEMAHEALGHSFAMSEEATATLELDSWPIEYWAHLVGHDPIEEESYQYTVDQEKAALELVSNFFTANSWSFDSALKDFLKMLPALSTIQGASSLARLHGNLSITIQSPIKKLAREKIPAGQFDSTLMQSYSQVRNDLETSGLQHYAWMLELVPYRDFITKNKLKRIGGLMNDPEPRRVSLKSDLASFEEINQSLSLRGGLASTQIARAYIKGLILLSHKQWKDVIANADARLALTPGSEPFLWQKEQARQQLGQFNLCVAENQRPWRYFDHRRELLSLECRFLEGRYTDAAQAAAHYRSAHPFDAEGAFWEMLAQIRMRRSVDKELTDIENFWGDRPLVRALRVFQYGYLGKYSQAEDMLNFQSPISYLQSEWGMLHFAQVWLRESFMGAKDNIRTIEISKLAEEQWKLGRLVRYNLPRDIGQVR